MARNIPLEYPPFYYTVTVTFLPSSKEAPEPEAYSSSVFYYHAVIERARARLSKPNEDSAGGAMAGDVV